MEEDKPLMQHEALDKIIDYLLLHKNKHVTTFDIKTNVFPNLSKEEIYFLCTAIKQYHGIVSGGDLSFPNTMHLTANELTQNFKNQGGFNKIYNDAQKIKEQQKVKEEKEERIKDATLSNFDRNKWAFRLSIAAIFITAISATKELWLPLIYQTQKSELQLAKEELNSLKEGLSQEQTILDSLQSAFQVHKGDTFIHSKPTIKP